MNKMNALKKYSDYLFFIFVIFSTYFTFLIGELYFQSKNSPDYGVYSKYFEYFNGELIYTDREQGLLYFFLVYVVLIFRQSFLSELTYDLFINSVIQTTNLFLYIVGIIGLYKLLRLKGFKSQNILLSIILINFFPVSLMLRWTFKPEILVFALLPWVFYMFELFFDTLNVKYLYFLSFPIALIMTSKPAVIAMFTIILIYYLIKSLKIFEFSKLVKPIFFFISIFFLLSYENFNANQRLFYEYPNLDSTIFNNPADISIFYNINFYDLFFAPFRHYHFDSLIGIFLLDTYGDYFFWYFDNDKSLFIFNSINLIKDIPYKFSTTLYQSQLLALFFSLVTYFSLVIFIFKEKSRRLYLMLPIIGFGILSLQALGFSSILFDQNINFDKSTSDVFKMFYLGFFIVISFIFIYNIIFEKFNKTKYIIAIFYIVSMLIIYGFPKNQDDNLDLFLVQKNNLSLTCNLNSLLLDIENTNCGSESYNLCVPNDLYIDTDYLKATKDKIDESFFAERELKDSKTENLVYINNFEDCLIYAEDGYISNKFNYSIINFPYINLLYFLISLFAFTRVNTLEKLNN